LFPQLNAALQELGVKPRNVYITEYPDASRDENGEFCGNILGEVFRDANVLEQPFRIDSSEARWAYDHVIHPLNRTVEAAAAAYGWNFVGGIEDAFARHGYGASSEERWIRTANESRKHQGPHHSEAAGAALGTVALLIEALSGTAWADPFQAAWGPALGAAAIRAWDLIHTKGTLHPNERGHAEIAKLIYERIQAPPIGANLPIPPAYLADGVLTIHGTSGNDEVSIAPGLSKNVRYVVSLEQRNDEGVLVRRWEKPVYEAAREIFFRGFAGDDRFENLASIPAQACGDGGDDILIGGVGSDVLYGGSGNDLLEGRGGDDDLFGESGFDTLSGGAGNDSLYGGQDNDVLNGSSGDDLLFGGDGKDELYGNSGDDRLFGEGGGDMLFGGTEDDILRGGLGNDWLRGESGNDRLYGDSGTDWMWGGAHNDSLFGGGDDDKLFGDSGNDFLYGEAGSDYLYGDSGNDYLDGGADFLRDTLRGGTGADRFVKHRHRLFLRWITEDEMITDFAIADFDRVEFRYH
jgi:Ca2+-binding RTX toxin-like protein